MAWEYLAFPRWDHRRIHLAVRVHDRIIGLPISLPLEGVWGKEVVRSYPTWEYFSLQNNRRSK